MRLLALPYDTATQAILREQEERAKARREVADIDAALAPFSKRRG